MSKPIIVRGLAKVGKIVNDDPTSSEFVVEFEKLRVFVDKRTQCIVLPEHCVKIAKA